MTLATAKRRKPRRRHHTVAYVVLSFVAFGLVLPLIAGSRDRGLSLSSLSVSPALESLSVHAPITLIEAAGLSLDSGHISINRLNNTPGAERRNESLLALLMGGKAQLVLDQPTLSFQAAHHLHGRHSFADTAVPMLAVLFESRFELLSIRHGTIEMHDSDARIVRLSDVNAEVSLKRKGVVAAKGTFDYRGQTLTFETNLNLGDRKSASRLPVKASIKGALLEATLDGRISLGDGLQLSSQSASFKTPRLRDLADWLGHPLPPGPGFDRLQIDGKLDMTEHSALFQQATIEIDGNSATGSLLCDSTPSGLSIDSTLAFRRLDITAYLPSTDDAQRTVGSAPTQATPNAIFPEADVRLSAETVVAGPVTLARSAASLSLRAGKLIADVAETELDGGGLARGQIDIDLTSAEYPFRVRGRLDQVDASHLSTALVGSPFVKGRATVAIDLTSTARARQRMDFQSASKGKFSLVLPRNGQIAVDLPQVIAASQLPKLDGKSPEKEAKEPRPALHWASAVRSPMAIDEANAVLLVDNGVWTLEPSTKLRSGNSLFSISGTIDRAASNLDVTIQRSNRLAEDSAPTNTVSIQGPISAPSLMARPTAPQGQISIPQAPPLQPASSQ